MFVNNIFFCYIFTMKKRILLIFIIAIVLVSPLLAKKIEPVIGGVKMYPDFWKGPTPSYLEGGIAYNFGPVVNDRDTRLIAVIGGGYIQREQYRTFDGLKIDPLSSPNSVIYDVATVLWKLGYSQEFLSSEYSDDALLTTTVAYEGRWEKAFDPYDSTKHPSVLGSLGNGYSEASGADHMFLSNAILADLVLNMHKDTGTYQQGFWGKLETVISPNFLNSALSGSANFGSIRLDLVGSYTPYQLRSEKGLNYFSVTLIDRLSSQIVIGNKVPSYFIGSKSTMGSKVRGYEEASYNSKLSFVNNLEIRLNGPDMGIKNLFPRLIIFNDLGFGTLGYTSNEDTGSSFIGSVGAALTISIFDAFDIGYQVAYTFGDSKYKNPTNKLYHGLVMGLAF